jgi:hypothetical protein
VLIVATERAGYFTLVYSVLTIHALKAPFIKPAVFVPNMTVTETAVPAFAWHREAFGLVFQPAVQAFLFDIYLYKEVQEIGDTLEFVFGVFVRVLFVVFDYFWYG